ncbi:site-specific integrase [Dyadobacter sp. OTU695]|uniref:site-specific integrase n=1 Tax=Dyadobacter sp. OTU695 TaxID=3043860 RepID=UPI00313D7EAC
MKTNYSLLFYLKKPKGYKNGAVPVYMRITVDGKRAETATGRQCDPTRWNASAGRMNGAKEDAKILNTYLDNLQALVLSAHCQLIKTGEVITAEALKNKLHGREEKPRLLMGIISDHNHRMKELIGSEYAPGTYKRFRVVHSHTLEFLKARFNATDFDIRRIDFAFVADYEFHLRRVRKMGNNATVKHLKMFRKIINICINNGWMSSDPFANYKGRYRNVDRTVLTEEDIEALARKEFVSDRLDQVRDTFLFCCFTGLAYSDVQKLTLAQVSRGIDGLPWIFTHRTKTETTSNIPLLPQAKKIMEKYADHPVCVSKGVLLPVPSNQKLNEYLKEIATLCGIDKPMTSHIARHTFATTVALQNGVPIETVSKILGHKSIRTTQIYAKIMDTKVSKDMKLLRGKIKQLAKTA